MQISSACPAGLWPMRASRSLCWRVLRSWRCAQCAQAAPNLHRDWGMPLPHLRNWARPCSAGQGSGADLRVCYLLNVACRLHVVYCVLHVVWCMSCAGTQGGARRRLRMSSGPTSVGRCTDVLHAPTAHVSLQCGRMSGLYRAGTLRVRCAPAMGQNNA